MLNKLKHLFEDYKNWLLFIWFLSLSALIVSLYFSEVLELIPCSLCWYQRIFIYPLTLILPIAYIIDDKKAFFYSATLSLIGSFFALYHVLLQTGLIAENSSVCRGGISCTDSYPLVLGLTLPFWSLITFLIITTVSLYNLKRSN